MNPEPWLRGTLKGTNPFIAPILYSFQMAREDLARFTEGLTDEQAWARPIGLAPVGFQIRHTGGSVERLIAYAEGKALTVAQLDALKHEFDPGEPLKDLLLKLDETLRNAEVAIEAIDPETFAEPRTVGRKALPTSVIGLLIHAAEHTQRHVGQAIVTAKIVSQR